MAQGLRPHRHVCFVSDIQPYYYKINIINRK